MFCDKRSSAFFRDIACITPRLQLNAQIPRHFFLFSRSILFVFEKRGGCRPTTRVTIRMPCSNRCSSSSEEKKKGKNRDPIKQRESPVSVYKKSLIQPLRKCRLEITKETDPNAYRTFIFFLFRELHAYRRTPMSRDVNVGYRG